MSSLYSATNKSFGSREDLFTKVLRFGVPTSAALHLILLALLNRTALNPPPISEPNIVTVDLSTLPTVPRQSLANAIQEPPRQIVSPSERTEDKPPDNPRFLSDRNSSVAKEQIKRGDPHAGLPGKVAPPQPQSRPQQHRDENSTKGKTTEKKEGRDIPALPEEGLRQIEKPKQKLALSLDSETVARKFNSKAEDTQSQQQVVRSPAPFSRPIGSGAQFFGSQGISDHLPNLPDGDITLLNAKADQHAVFVRRVATQVFSLLRSEGWDLLGARDILGIRGFSTVRAKMSPEGKLMRVTLEEDSGSERFDQVVIAAAEKGTRDPNPPKGAEAEDGNIYFIFRSKSWVQGGVHPKSGAPLERRWLLLQTGLE